MDNLSAMWEKLSLSEFEGSKYLVQDSRVKGEYFLAAKFFTGRVLSMKAITQTFKLMWRTEKGFEVQDMGNHRVLFAFANALNVDRVMKGEPWFFDKHLVALKRVMMHTDVRSLVFDKTSLWVQVHDLPIGSLTVTVAKDIASVVGNVDESETDNGDREGCNFMRVMVVIDVSEPLCRGRKIAWRSGKESQMIFKYKRLQNICYWCGRFTHNDKDCPTWLNSKGPMK